MPSITVEVDGQVIPEAVEKSVRIESIVGQIVDTCDLSIYDRHRTITIPAMRDLIITRNDTGARIFGGLIADVSAEVEGFTRTWHIGAQDYTILLDRSLVIQSYPPAFVYDGLIGDKAIIANAFEENIVGAYGTRTNVDIGARTHVQQGLRALSHQQFRYATLREVLAQLSQYEGFEFYVDYDKELHYFYRESITAPYTLSDAPASASNINYRELKWRRDGTRVVNTFALFGDKLVSDAQAYVLPADGATRDFDLSFETIRINYPLLPEPGQNTMRIDLNANANRSLTANTHNGGDGRATLTVTTGAFINDGVEQGDIVINSTDGSWGAVRSVSATTITASLEGGARNRWNDGDVAVVPTWRALDVSNDALQPEAGDVYHDTLGKTLLFDTPPPQNAYAIRLRFTHNFVAGQISSDLGSINRYGRVFARRVVAADVNSAAGIVNKMAHLQEQYADALEVATMRVDDTMFPTGDNRRFEPGQWVRFSNSILDVRNRDMLIHRVTTRVLGGQHIEYELELRDWEVDII